MAQVEPIAQPRANGADQEKKSKTTPRPLEQKSVGEAVQESRAKPIIDAPEKFYNFANVGVVIAIKGAEIVELTVKLASGEERKFSVETGRAVFVTLMSGLDEMENGAFTVEYDGD